jgi:hypothetical protein
MFKKPIEQLSIGDIRSLIENRISEGPMLEYKEAHPLKIKNNIDDSKLNLAKYVSSFANSAGGYIVFGVKEEKGVATAITPFEVEDFDKLRNTLDQILDSKIERKIRSCEYHAIKTDSNKIILALKVPRSIAKPHGIKKSAESALMHYHRVNGRTIPYTQSELANAYNAQYSIEKRIENFRLDRINAILANDIPYNLNENPRIIVHVIPISAFDDPSLIIDIGNFYKENRHNKELLLPSVGSLDSRLNLEGFLISDAKNGYAYTQFFRNGCIEAVDAFTIYHPQNGEPPFISGPRYEQNIVTTLSKLLEPLIATEISLPIYVGITLLGVKNFKISSEQYDTYQGTIDRENLILPAVVLADQNHIRELPQHLKCIFDQIWQASNREKSLNYDTQGEWKYPYP